jgi:uncharacterized protein with PQ loop repeat
MSSSIPIAAGAVATVVFAASALPMLGKAARTKDLASYSRPSLVMANVGNAFYSVYVFHLPPGPIWVLHSFYLTSTALMLLWSLRYAKGGATASTTASTTASAPNQQGSQSCTPSTLSTSRP